MYSETNASPSITLKLFGGVSCWEGERCLVEMEAQQAAWLLAYLALHADATGNREGIGEAFWPDKDVQRAKQNLRQLLHSLKDLLEPFPILADLLQIERGKIYLNNIQTDVRTFEALVAQAKSSSASETRIALIREALALYSAPFLPQCYMDWALEARGRLEALHREALHDLCHAYEGLHQWEKALEAAKTAARKYPFSEEASFAVMRLYAKAGLPAEIQKQAKEMEAFFQKEYGAPLDESEQSLIRQWLEEARRNAIKRAESPALQTTPSIGANELVAPSIASSANSEARIKLRSPRRLAAFAFIALLALSWGWYKSHLRHQVIPRPGEKLSGEEAWVNHILTREGDKDSEPTAMTSDQEGNIYVTGFVDTEKTDVDFVTMKYARNGDVLWEQRFDGAGHDVDRARSVSVDAKGNVYVTGESLGTSGNNAGRLSELDIMTVKYAPNGRMVWSQPYDSPWHGRDSGWQNLLDNDGNLYVFGQCQNEKGKGFVYVLLKYDADGKLTEKPLFAPSRSELEQPSPRMALSLDGTLYFATIADDAGNRNIMILNCYRNGRIVWKKPYPHKDKWASEFLQLKVNRAGEILAARANFMITDHEYSLCRLSAQDGSVLREWKSDIEAPPLQKAGFVEGEDGVVYMGACWKKRLFISKFTPKLDLEWNSEYFGSLETPRFGGIALSQGSGVYVSGSAIYLDPSKSGSSDAKGEEIFTRLLDANWIPKRLMRYAGAEIRTNQASALLVDSEGSPVICGKAFDGKYYRIVAIRYHP